VELCISLISMRQPRFTSAASAALELGYDD
jgi:hypothetical protein